MCCSYVRNPTCIKYRQQNTLLNDYTLGPEFGGGSPAKLQFFIYIERTKKPPPDLQRDLYYRQY